MKTAVSFNVQPQPTAFFPLTVEMGFCTHDHIDNYLNSKKTLKNYLEIIIARIGPKLQLLFLFLSIRVPFQRLGPWVNIQNIFFDTSPLFRRTLSQRCCAYYKSENENLLFLKKQLHVNFSWCTQPSNSSFLIDTNKFSESFLMCSMKMFWITTKILLRFIYVSAENETEAWNFVPLTHPTENSFSWVVQMDEIEWSVTQKKCFKSVRKFTNNVFSGLWALFSRKQDSRENLFLPA